jgi:hypothetical protein
VKLVLFCKALSVLAEIGQMDAFVFEIVAGEGIGIVAGAAIEFFVVVDFRR